MRIAIERRHSIRNLILRLCALIIAVGLPVSGHASECLDCHGERGFSTLDSSGAEISLYVDSAQFATSIHGSFDCTDCHTGIESIPHPDHLPSVECGDCHGDVASAYKFHGLRKQSPGDRFPACRDCHGTHNIRPASDPQSMANPNNLPATCGHCHENPAIIGQYDIPMIAPVEIYETSVHARVRGDDSGLVASCIDCHSRRGSAHSILAPIDPASSIYHFNIASTCGRCHQQIQTDYERGIHGRAAAHGETDAPVCTNCHGDHAILGTDDPKSRVSPTRISLTVCGPCHENNQLNLKYGLPTNIMDTWRHSYHGLKSTDGDPHVANCSSCHRAHLILPPTDSESSIAPANVHSTCAKCHASISPQLARIEIHKTEGVFLNYTGKTFQMIYIVAIIVIIGLMGVHWLIDLTKRIRVLNRGKQVIRMNRNELWQHTFLMVTFTVLAITGFAFHYSGTWWARLLFGWPGGFAVRRIVHLVAAVLFMATAVWHILYLRSHRGRAFLRDIFPRGRDFRQFFQTMAYDLELRKEPPRFGRFSYIEKAEYWALVWGTVVMTVTGVALWFGTTTENILEVGAIGVMLIVHFYEAILAGLAILIWHLYSTIFNPPVYPNNPSWYTGKMPVQMYRDEHADDPALVEVDAEKTKPPESAAPADAEISAEAESEESAEDTPAKEAPEPGTGEEDAPESPDDPTDSGNSLRDSE